MLPHYFHSVNYFPNQFCGALRRAACPVMESSYFEFCLRQKIRIRCYIYTLARTLQQAQSPGLNCYFCTKLKRKRHRPLTASPSFSQQSDCRNCRAPLPGILCLKFMNKQPAPQFRLKPGRLWRHKQTLVRYPVQFFNRRRVHGESRLTVCMYPPLQL